MVCRKKQQCTGCGLCASVCPHRLIQMRPDQEGFLYPEVVPPERCTQCGKCRNVCPMDNPPARSQGPLAAVSGYFANREKLLASASGGLATAISEKVIRAGGAVAGVQYADSFRIVRFAMAERLDELASFKSSKYVQAEKGAIYAETLTRLHRGQTVLFIGLPCEVAAMTAHAGTYASALYTCDLICHGPTSPKVQQEFCDSLETALGAALVQFSVRYKKEGWKPPYIRGLAGNGREHLQPLADSDYGVAFRFLKRPSCHACPFKGTSRAADITIGDYHGVARNSAEYNRDGVSVGLVNSPRGFELLAGLDAFMLAETNMAAALRNRAWHTSIGSRFNRRQFARVFSANGLHAASSLRSVRFSDGWHAARFAGRTHLSKLKQALRRRAKNVTA